MSISNHDCIPYYYWYTSPHQPFIGNRTHYYNGKQYIAFADEPQPRDIDRYRLTFIGVGDIDYIKE